MKKVIIAEDLKDRRDFLVETISSEGIKIDEVDNGSELVEKVKLGGYNLIITDNIMPNMNGLEAIREIRKFDKQTPIYLLSSLAGGDAKVIEKQALGNGANGFIKKDYDLTYKIKEIKKAYLE